MQLIHVDDILIPNDRIRKEFPVDSHRQLRESIESHGLFHPLLLRPDGRTLVAGERRLRVLRELHFEKRHVVFGAAEIPLGEVPVVVMGSHDELHYLSAEFTENARRTALTWQEETEYLHRYHTLQKELNPKHRQEDTRQATRSGVNAVNHSLIVAPFLNDEEVRNAATRDEALKILERRFERGHREAIAKSLGTTTRGSLHTLLHGDLRQILPTLETSRFDAVIADPPYGVNAHTWDNMSAVQHTYLDTPEYSDELYQCIAAEGFRLAKPEAHIYLFCESRRFGKVLDLLSAVGWRVWPWPFIFWRGATNGICPWPEHGPRRTYECIAYAVKGNRRVNCILPDVLHYPDTSGVERGAHKPAALYADLLARTCAPGNEVLDPCIGTGSVFDAASGARVRVTGIEIEAAAYAQAGEKLK